MPFMSMKGVMLRQGPDGPKDVRRRVGMNTDDCENCAIQMKHVVGTCATNTNRVSAEYFHGPANRSNANFQEDEESLREMKIGKLSKREQRVILLTNEVIGKSTDINIGYFVTGSASKASDVHTEEEGDTASGSLAVKFPIETGAGTGARLPRRSLLASKLPGTAAGVSTSGCGGHCTCSVHVTRKDGLIQMGVVEGTGHVQLVPANIPFDVRHRGTLDAADTTQNHDDAYCKKVGRFNGPITLDNVADITTHANLGLHVTTITASMAVPGCDMRPDMVLGTAKEIDGNANSFYTAAVSLGCNQMVQTDDKDGIKPGMDVKQLINQKVFQVHKLKDAKDSPQEIRNKMGKATGAMVQIYNPKSKESKEHVLNCQRIGAAIGPLGLSVAMQEKHIMSKFCDFASLKAHFPNDKTLSKKFGRGFITFVAYNIKTDCPVKRTKTHKAIVDHIKYLNDKYVNVSFADPLETPAGELMALIKIYGVPPKAV
jgi:hypothetical protein